MTPINMGRRKMLDGEYLFTLYFREMGAARSINKVVKYLTSKGIVNQDNKNLPFTVMAIWFSIYTWAISNVDKSYDIYIEAIRDEGKFHTKEEWEYFVQTNYFGSIKKSRRRFERCLNQNKRSNLIY